MLADHSGGDCDVIVLFRAADGTRARLRLGNRWRVQVTGELLEALKSLSVVGKVRLRATPTAEAQGDYYRSPDALADAGAQPAVAIPAPAGQSTSELDELYAATAPARSDILH